MVGGMTRPEMWAAARTISLARTVLHGVSVLPFEGSRSSHAAYVNGECLLLYGNSKGDNGKLKTTGQPQATSLAMNFAECVLHSSVTSSQTLRRCDC